MNEGFYIGMKVSLDGELGLVVKGEGNSEWDKEAGLIRWDLNDEKSTEDWRGLFGTFIDSGGKEIDPDTEFKFIDDEGKLKK